MLPCPFWACYSAVMVFLLAAAMARIDYNLLVDPKFRSSVKRIHVGFEGIRSVMMLTFFLKQAISVALTACSVFKVRSIEGPGSRRAAVFHGVSVVFKGGDVAHVLERLVRVPGRLSRVHPGMPGLSLGARWTARAQWVVAGQLASFASASALLLVMIYLGDELSLGNLACLPALYLVNVQFTDAVRSVEPMGLLDCLRDQCGL